jgi:hypothetical protein
LACTPATRRHNGPPSRLRSRSWSLRFRSCGLSMITLFNFVPRRLLLVNSVTILVCFRRDIVVPDHWNEVMRLHPERGRSSEMKGAFLRRIRHVLLVPMCSPALGSILLALWLALPTRQSDLMPRRNIWKLWRLNRRRVQPSRAFYSRAIIETRGGATLVQNVMTSSVISHAS